MKMIQDTVDFISAIESGEWFKVENYLDDDFKFYGPLPDPIDKSTWLEYQKAIRAAFPDWSFHLSKAEQGGHKVIITIHITGTHTKPLDLPFPGSNPLPPTQTKIDLPVEHTTVAWRGDKISEIRSEDIAHGGLGGLFEQLGLE